MAKKSSKEREIDALLKKVAKAVRIKNPQKAKWNSVDGRPSEASSDDEVDKSFKEAKKLPFQE